MVGAVDNNLSSAPSEPRPTQKVEGGPAASSTSTPTSSAPPVFAPNLPVPGAERRQSQRTEKLSHRQLLWICRALQETHSDLFHTLAAESEEQCALSGEAGGQSSHASFSQRSVYVRKLESFFTGDMLYAHFKKFGAIEQADVIRHRDGRCKGFGYVRFVNVEAVDECCRETEHILNGKRVVVKRRTDGRDGRPTPQPPCQRPQTSGFQQLQFGHPMGSAMPPAMAMTPHSWGTQDMMWRMQHMMRDQQEVIRNQAQMLQHQQLAAMTDARTQHQIGTGLSAPLSPGDVWGRGPRWLTAGGLRQQGQFSPTALGGHLFVPSPHRRDPAMADLQDTAVNSISACLSPIGPGNVALAQVRHYR